MGHRVFGRDWFVKHQAKLLWWLNAPVLRYWFRWVLRINGERSAVGGRAIIFILPHAIWWGDGDSFIAEFRTHNKFAKRLYYALEPLWWAMHFWDWLIADRWVPRLSFGFDSLTKYPYPGDATQNTVDGYVKQGYSYYGGQSWATIRGAAGSSSGDTDSYSHGVIIGCDGSGQTNLFINLERSIFLYDTSALGSSATISAATMSLYGNYKSVVGGISGTFDINIYTSSPASDTALAAGDFDSLGTTAQCDTAITNSGFSTTAYNDWSLNSTGRGNISKTGITKFGARYATEDAQNNAPGWSSDGEARHEFIYADNTGTSQDPKLVITYTSSLDYSYTGTFYGPRFFVSDRMIEKLVTGATSSTQWTLANRYIEKVAPGNIAAVDTWVTTRHIERLATGTVNATFSWTSTKTFDISLTGTLSSVRTWLADRMIEKYVDGSITAVDTWTAAITGLKVDQEYFQYYKDDGSESAATALGALNQNRTGTPNDFVRLRFLVYVTGEAGSRQYKLEWRRDGTNTWREVIQ